MLRPSISSRRAAWQALSFRPCAIWSPTSASAVVDAAAPRLKNSDRRALAHGMKQAPAWMRPALDRIVRQASG